MKGKPEKIDILKLYANGDTTKWNDFLTNCVINGDLPSLEKVLYGIQLGMNDLAKKKLNTEKINIFFLRIQRSIENTMKEIMKTKESHPLDDPFNKEKFGHTIASKKKRDQDIEKYLRKVRF